MSTITLRLDDRYTNAIEQRVEQMRDTSARELRAAGRDELAEAVSDSDPSRAEYVKALVEHDLRDAGIIDNL